MAINLEPSARDLVPQAVFGKVTRRLIPFLFLLYILNILDRVNVGFAALQMLGDLGMSKEVGEQVFGMGVGVFFIGYFAFQVPSNLLLKRIGARRWIAGIMISWGIISSGMMFVKGPWSFYLLRFLLGLAEAGFFPGMILYLSFWFPAPERARAVARFMTASALAGIIGGPISGAILQYTDLAAGLAGWQWLFLLEGLPSVIVGITVLFYLTDRPEQADWLASGERQWLAERMGREEKYREERHGLTLLQALSNPRVWLLCAIYFSVAMASNTFGGYLPKLIEDHFTGQSTLEIALLSAIPKEWQGKDLEIGLLSAIPNLAAMISMVIVGTHSDRTGERRWHVAVTAFVAAVGWMLVALSPSPWIALLGLTLAQMGMLSMLAPFWSLPTSFLSGAAAAGGIALINAMGNLGGFVGPNVIGQVKAATGSYSSGLLFLAAVLIIGGFLALRARHDRALEAPSKPVGQT